MPSGTVRELPGQKQPVNEWQDPKAIKPGGDDAFEIEVFKPNGKS